MIKTSDKNNAVSAAVGATFTAAALLASGGTAAIKANTAVIASSSPIAQSSFRNAA